MLLRKGNFKEQISLSLFNRLGRYCLRTIWDALLYLVKTGCQWRMLPKCFPDWLDGILLLQQMEGCGDYRGGDAPPTGTGPGQEGEVCGPDSGHRGQPECEERPVPCNERLRRQQKNKRAQAAYRHRHQRVALGGARPQCQSARQHHGHALVRTFKGVPARYPYHLCRWRI